MYADIVFENVSFMIDLFKYDVLYYLEVSSELNENSWFYTSMNIKTLRQLKTVQKFTRFVLSF